MVDFSQFSVGRTWIIQIFGSNVILTTEITVFICHQINDGIIFFLITSLTMFYTMFYTMLSFENFFGIVIIFTGSTAVISCEVHDIFSFAIVAFVFFRWR